MNRITLIFLFSILSVLLSGQEYGAAILLDSDEVFGHYNEMILKNFKSTYDKQSRGHTEFYTWDGNSESEPEVYLPYKTEKLGSMPILKTVYLNTNFSLSREVRATYKFDTLKNVTAMYVYYPHKFEPVLKVVDLPSSEVDVYYKYDTSDWGVKALFLVKDFKKYFGKNPNKMEESNKLLFDSNMNKFLKSEGAELDRFYDEKVQSWGKKLEEISKNLKSLSDTKFWKVIDYGYDDKGKLEEFSIDAKRDDNLEDGDVIDIYKQNVIDDFEYYEYLSYVTVKEVFEDKVRVKPFSLMKKKIAEALEGDDDVIFTRSKGLIKDLNRGDEPYKRVQVITDCTSCFSELDRKILSSGSTKLIARNIDGPTQYFTNKYTDEKFLDYNMNELQGRQQGVDYIFEATAAGINATDVETGRIVFTASQEKNGLAKMMQIGTASVSNLMMDIMDIDFKIVKVLKEKNGRLEKFVAYNPLGFGRTYNIVKVIEEEVGGRKINREEIIGKCYIGKAYTNTLAEVKVAKGEKELYLALKAGDKIRYRF